MKKSIVVFLVFLNLVFCQDILAREFNGKTLLEGEIIRMGDFAGIVPTNKNAWPLLTDNPHNSFAFVLFYPEKVLKHLSLTSIKNDSLFISIPYYERNKSTLHLSTLQHFKGYFNELKKLSRYELVDKKDDIVSAITNAHKQYHSEYLKYTDSVFNVYDTRKLNQFEHYYYLDRQTLQLRIIGPKLVKAFNVSLSRKRTYPEELFLTWGAPKFITVKLPAKKAAKLTGDITKSGGSSFNIINPPIAEYKYIIEPKKGVWLKHFCSTNICGWMPSLYIHEIHITLKNSKGEEIVVYKLDKFYKNKVGYVPSFDNSERCLGGLSR